MSAYRTIRAITIGIVTIYVFWAIFESHPENSFVRSGVLTLSLALVMGAVLVLKPDFPIWYLGPLLFSLCILIMFFLVQRTYHALRNRRRTSSRLQ